MKSSFILVFGFLAVVTLNAAEFREWVKIQFDPDIPQIQLLVQDGTIEAESPHAGQGWILADDYSYYSNYFSIQKLASEMREVRPLEIGFSPDSVGEVLATYPMPPGIPSERGFGYDGTYFYVVSAQTNNERIFKLDPNNNFAVVSSFPSPGVGSHLPWGIESDGKSLYIADALQDLIFKTDTSGAVLFSFPTGGPITTGLGYRTNELWNGDIGDVTQGIPPRIYKSDTLGTLLAQYTQSVTVNGVACSDSAVYLGRNINNGHDIRAMDPTTFAQLFSFASPLDFPNGLAFDGAYLWICGRTSGVQYIVKVDVGLAPQPPQPINVQPFELVADGHFNNRFNADFDSEGNMHIVYATQFETVSSTKEIVYGTNKSGVWELEQITNDLLMDELPVIDVDANGIVHIMWNGFVPQENDVELFYTNNGDIGGTFFPKIQITSQAVDGVQGHTWPTMAVQDNGTVHFAFVSSPVGAPEAYYGNYFQGTTSTPVNISNNANYDSDPRILLDASNNPHVFWRESTTGLNHATNASGSWVKEFITDMGSSRPAAAIDDQDILHFAVTKDEVVKYGNNAGGSFSVTDTVAVHVANCFYPDMAVDESGGIHLTYHAFGDSVNSWPGHGEIFYTNNAWWGAGKFPQNVSQLETEQEIYPGMAVRGSDEIIIGWALTGSTDQGVAQANGVFSNIRMATTIPDSGGLLSGRINTSADYHHFGYVEPLDSAFWTLEIYNRGTRSLTVSNIEWESSYDPPFIVTTDFSAPQTINFRDTLTVTVKAFIDAPVRMDTSLFDGLLKITSDDPLEPEKDILLEVETEIVGIENDDPSLITENKLYPNFPNPFNPTTHIGFQIADFTLVSLKIYDITGRDVATLISQRLTPGNYEYEWDAGESASGIYFYRLKIGDKFVQTRRMLLLK